MPPKINMESGMRFGMWTVLQYEKASKWGDRLYKCRCDCGHESIVAAAELQKGNSTNCGCIGAKRLANSRRTHGQSGTKLYKVWSSMKHRCSNPNDLSYANYGGR